MERLLPHDPAWLGQHRLLARLGAGGMGVVYLARARTGELAAVKVIQPEYADDPDFRTRFNREVAAARRVDSPWVVRVTGADPAASAPWLATAFVPGPSLAQAVASCGPLPPDAVRALGGMLARALTAVHAAGLVHRDVKPGNVLLALDGPRLIDFGIARSTSAQQTALTSANVVVGTPGFLSPEQARAQQAGPASDVFSLGCVLAFAATGRPPFGTGTADAVLYRTVHDEPDLHGVSDPALRTLLERCLAKGPAERPPAAELAENAAVRTPAGASADTARADAADWLPDPVVQMIADQTADMLDLPAVPPTASAPPPEPAPSATRPSTRRRFLAAAAAGATLLTGGTAAGWAALHGDGGGSAGGGRRWALGVQADLSGPGRDAGLAQERGARLAVEEFNARGSRPFTLDLNVVDDHGTAAGARSAAQRLTGDNGVLAVLGPTGWTSAEAAVGTYERVGLALVSVSELSVSAANAALVFNPHAYFHAAPLTMIGGYLTDTALAARGARRPGLLIDRAGRLTGWETSEMAQQSAAGMGLDVYARYVPALAPDPSVVLTDMLDRRIDGLYYTGTPERAALLARALARRGFDGPRFLDHPAATHVFTAAAGSAAEGWQAITPYISPDAPAVKAFAAAHRRRFGSAPGIWAAEAYDATRLIIDRLAALRAREHRRPTRSQLAAALLTSRFKGLATTYAFDKDRTFKADHLFRVRVSGGRFRYAGTAPIG
ncbi:hypothetical protein GCM10018793_57560 [Streptomyces sulfonofaciens]|uniref:Protein kinase domain-containing protein n=1 Tax=Streptomyces sulfonofaciens TaxID=68272 RepID=A0A919GK39_9ACTN|nr:bifunctional serine/threonine-protein kinase/ABC transporter substrate-binding protein [Streptomyces sulfonofaciens]GHH86285.1 hypothetical protein GCM10018793_57560 [Streptomyces sulfonofaciens]